MERQIKFRGKNKRTGEWCYGDLEYNRSKRIARIHSYDDEGRYLVQTEVDENTIGQFTGLHDKDGKEIYEGDIADLVSITPRYWRVVYSGGTFSLYGINSTLPCWKPFFNDEYGVCYVYSFIGNIYDNTDLAKED